MFGINKQVLKRDDNTAFNVRERTALFEMLKICLNHNYVSVYKVKVIKTDEGLPISIKLVFKED